MDAISLSVYNTDINLTKRETFGYDRDPIIDGQL